MIFGDIYRLIQTRCKDAAEENIKNLLNSCLRELSLFEHRRERRNSVNSLLWVIDSTNNILKMNYFSEAGGWQGEEAITLTANNYTIEELENHLKSLIDAAFAQCSDSLVNYSKSTNKWTISTHISKKVKYINEGSTAGGLLGFTEDQEGYEIVGDKKSFPHLSPQGYLLKNDIINVHEVYLNNLFIPQTLTYEEYVENQYSTNSLCYIGKDRKIYFPVDLGYDDSLKIVADVTREVYLSAIDKDTNINLADYYLPIIENYILKEIYLLPETENWKKHVLYQQKYDMLLPKLQSSGVGNQDMNFGTDI